MWFNRNDSYPFLKEISNLEHVGGYSINGDNIYCNDLTQLKYYKEPADLKSVRFNLDSNEDTTFKTDAHPKLDFMLQWISDNFDCLKAEDSKNSSRWLEPEFISLRGTLKSVFLTPYEKYEGWIVCAAKFKGTIYLCRFYTDKEKQRISQETAEEKRTASWGFKFKQYMRSDSPNVDPDPSAPLNQCEEFNCVFKAKIGNKSLRYGAEMDAVRCQQTIRDTIVGKNIEFVELKTCVCPLLTKEGRKQYLKMLSWWAQSYLVGVRTIICGCRDGNGVVYKIEKVTLDEIELDITEESKQKSINFCDQFLEFVKSVVCKEHDECIYKFEYVPDDSSKIRISTTEMRPDPESEYFLLRSWYIERANSYFGRR